MRPSVVALRAELFELSVRLCAVACAILGSSLIVNYYQSGVTNPPHQVVQVFYMTPETQPGK
jgi:hypothetical protein